jgi:hypothetical protein
MNDTPKCEDAEPHSLILTYPDYTDYSEFSLWHPEINAQSSPVDAR